MRSEIFFTNPLSDSTLDYPESSEERKAVFFFFTRLGSRRFHELADNRLAAGSLKERPDQ